MTFRSVATSALIVSTAAFVLHAQGPQPRTSASTHTPDLSGGWVRIDTEGNQSYGGIDAAFPRARLLPEYAAMLPPEQDQGLDASTRPTEPAHAAGVPYLIPNLVGREPRCGIGGGAAGVDINSTAAFIVQSKDEIVLARDSSSGSRHIWMDGRKHPANWIPNASGHSVGHFENGTLVVHSVGFAPGMTAFGRGYKTPETELTEVFKLAPDGKHLSITYTWNDPKVYVKPHVYTIPFERVPGAGYVLENWCDASIPHPEVIQSIVPPVQR